MSPGIAICRHFEDEFRAALAAEGLGGLPVTLFRGACEGHLEPGPGPSGEAGVVRLSGDCAGLPGPDTGFGTCFAMVLGPALADAFLGQGLHLMTPSMVRAWSEARRPWGFTEDQIRAFFGEAVRGFRVIDCGVRPVEPRDLETLRRETGLPVDVWPATLDPLRATLRRALAPAAPEAPAPEAWLLSDYAMAYDLLGRMVTLEDEKQVTHEIANLFLMLCAPGRVLLRLDRRGGHPAQWLTLPEGMEGAPAEGDAPGTFELELNHQGVRLGTLRVEDLAFPARREPYLKLGILLAPLLSLVLANVRTRGQRLAAIVESSEEALRESQERFETAFRMMPVPACITTLVEGEFLAVNRAFVETFGTSEARIVGRRTSELGGWVEPSQRDAVVASLSNGVPVRGLEAQLRLKDGRLVWVSYSGERIAHNGQDCLLTTAIDITRRKLDEETARRMLEDKAELEEQLNQAQKMESLGRLAGGIAHDMNNVLGAIFAVTQALQTRLESDSDLAGTLAVIERAAVRGRDLVKGLVGFARKDRPTLVPVDLNDLVRKEAALLEHTLLQKYHLVVSLEEPLPQIEGEAGTLGSALMNLCLNAVDAMAEGGTLGIRTRRTGGGSVQIIVEDTGHGMSPEVAKRAMEPFYTTKPVGKGTGLGLAMAFTTARAHGGTLEIQSQEGRGTRILMTLPIMATGPGEAVPAAPPPASGASFRILMVDDDELLRSTVPMMLQILGHQVVAVDGGRAALDHLAREARPDLVILDLNMPDLNGAETLGLIRARFQDLPVLLASGYVEPAVECLVEADPCTLVITKPFSLEELRERFRGVEAMRAARGS